VFALLCEPSVATEKPSR